MSRLADLLMGMDRGTDRPRGLGRIPGLDGSEGGRRRWRVGLVFAMLAGMGALGAAVLWLQPRGPAPITASARPAAAPAPVPAPAPAVTPEETLPELTREGLRKARAGAFAEAARLFRKGLAVDPNDAETWNNLGVVLIQLGESKEGIEAFRRALVRAPRHAEASRNLAVALDGQGQWAEAVRHYRAFLTVSPEGHPDRAEVRRRLGALRSERRGE